MENWRTVWRDGFAPVISDRGLESLRLALIEDRPELVQGSTSIPPPLQAVQDWPVEAACALGYCGWKGEDLAEVGQVEEYFARLCFEADNRLGEPAACRWFLNWFDETPRGDMRRELIAEVELTLAGRAARRAANLVELPSVGDNADPSPRGCTDEAHLSVAESTRHD